MSDFYPPISGMNPFKGNNNNGSSNRGSNSKGNLNFTTTSLGRIVKKGFLVVSALTGALYIFNTIENLTSNNNKK